MNVWRKELSDILRGLPCIRTAALRRSLTDEWLYATDLPSVCDRKTLSEGICRMKAAGWETVEENGWLMLNKPRKEPPDGWFDGLFGKEAACCLSLIKRHPSMRENSTNATERLFIKAGEEGPDAYEAACRKLHQEWAEALREKRSIPQTAPAFFGG